MPSPSTPEQSAALVERKAIKAVCRARCEAMGDPPCYELDGDGPVDAPFRWPGDCADCEGVSCGNIARSVIESLTSKAGTDEVVERVAEAIRAYFVEKTGFVTVDGDGCVSAYYGGNWIALSPTAIARAALAACQPMLEGERLIAETIER